MASSSSETKPVHTEIPSSLPSSLPTSLPPPTIPSIHTSDIILSEEEVEDINEWIEGWKEGESMRGGEKGLGLGLGLGREGMDESGRDSNDTPLTSRLKRENAALLHLVKKEKLEKKRYVIYIYI